MQSKQELARLGTIQGSVSGAVTGLDDNETTN
jgi:hypothetical protein